MWRNAQDRPIGNVYLARNGDVWVGAAGAANTAGKGGPTRLSRGTVPVDGGNTRTFAVEAANNGVGQTWPRVQIDAYFVLSNEINRRCGNLPSDLFTHQAYAPTRKIDPATAAAIEGGWRPSSRTSSGSWAVADVQAEATRRAGSGGSTIKPEDDIVTDDDIARIAQAVWRIRSTPPAVRLTRRQCSAGLRRCGIGAEGCRRRHLSAGRHRRRMTAVDLHPSLYRVAGAVLVIAAAANVALFWITADDDVFANVVAIASGVVVLVLLVSAGVPAAHRWREEACLLALAVWVANIIEFATQDGPSLDRSCVTAVLSRIRDSRRRHLCRSASRARRQWIAERSSPLSAGPSSRSSFVRSTSSWSGLPRCLTSSRPSRSPS